MAPSSKWSSSKRKGTTNSSGSASEERGKVDIGGGQGRDDKTVLVVFVHPDDAGFTCDGTIARWAARGSGIDYAVCRDGSRGSRDDTLPAGRWLGSERLWRALKKQFIQRWFGP